MADQYETPGVYIEEITGPGVIPGVGTSTAAFIGPALNGPIGEARRVTSYDEFLDLYAEPQAPPDQILWPYITSPRRFYMADAVKGFFENDGPRAYIVRIGTGDAARHVVQNRALETVFEIVAQKVGSEGNSVRYIVRETHATGDTGVHVATGQSSVTRVVRAADPGGPAVIVTDSSPFRPGDVVTEDDSSRATIERIHDDLLTEEHVITLSNDIAGLAATDTLKIADIASGQRTFRLESTAGIFPGTVVLIQRTPGDATGEEYAVVQSIHRGSGFVTLASGTSSAFPLSATGPVLISQDFQLTIMPPVGAAETYEDLSLNSLSPNYVFSSVNSRYVSIRPPGTPPIATLPNALVRAEAAVLLEGGRDDDPGSVTAAEFEDGLAVLNDIDDVNLVCAPDAVALGAGEMLRVHQAVITHCVQRRDRFGILDSGMPVTGMSVSDELRNVELHRAGVESERGFAALYYPWILIPEPILPSQRRAGLVRTVLVPPSGHIAGVFGRTDIERGVHKAPANTNVRGVAGLQRILTDAQQGPLNREGINVLRIFPGSGQVTVWGARTTVDPNITDWIYVNVRRLMLYIEESIEEGIRWAVFEPNNLALWQKLKRTIGEFLSRVWRDGGLFGATEEQAYYVRIDEALNPPSTRALGRLYIEIGVAPVRPAEFIIVRIGIWDGGSQVLER